MFFKTYATVALATGLAAAKPIAPRTPNNNLVFGNNAGRNAQGFSFIDGFNNFNNQQQVIQIQEQNLQIIDNGFQQQVVQQANEVLIVNNQQNGFNNQLNNLFRKSNFRNNFNQQSTVMLVVQEIQIAVDDGRGNQFQQNVFAQSAVVANRGLAATQTVMIFQQETLIAQNILGGVGGFQNFQNNILGGGKGRGGNNIVSVPTQTAAVQLFGSKPTWSSVAEDPAATLGGVWQAELEDVQKIENNNGDNDLNNQAAEQEKKALDEAKAAEEAAKKEAEQQQQQQNQEGEQNNAEEEQKKAEEAQNQQSAAEPAATAAPAAPAAAPAEGEKL
ncbi:hypothetical protein BU24DRAFT_49478 [Aaosphaeria arxii CBS 175.79]|uniref:Uncharacterized protein n=1 Tax=Aaosphaeria arxii CBS 175.79 TaxID=1450172 RepID=A0A6A5XDJ6_9PLEO|nr:uncharacterized protein BU24DRAFT_49478 [Aaosphaeria arxii CBS 175.79]KAF2010950.1 hypothetical protein BU24DRAFT_49478 [Aaosphaeria arxii CBS 175.79]